MSEDQASNLLPGKNKIFRHGDKIEIYLSQGQCAIADYADYERIKEYRWYASAVKSGKFYVHSSAGKPKKMLHRFIASAGRGHIVDHINRDPLDNRKCNLRYASHSLNNHNSKAYGKHGYRGVSKNRDAWVATISQNNKHKVFGRYGNKIEAAIRYDLEAIKIYGKDATLNFKVFYEEMEALVKIFGGKNGAI